MSRTLRVALVNPPRHGGMPVVREERHEFRLAQTVTHPLSLMHAAAQLAAAGYAVSLIDANALDLSTEALANELDRVAPTLIVCRLALDGADSDLAFLAHLPAEIPVVARSRLVDLGRLEGPLLERFPRLDGVVTGELEAVVLPLARALADGRDGRDIDGICWREESRGRREARVSDWSDVPMPAYDLLGDLRRYGRRNHNPRRLVAQLESSRGCSYGCTFCIQQRTAWRAWPAPLVAEHMERLVCDFRIGHLQFQDDTFTMRPARVAALCDEISRRPGLRTLTWECNARADHVTPALLAAMRRAGCRRIHFGVESLRDEVLEAARKGHDASATEQAIRMTFRAGISPGASAVLGLPGDTAAGMLETARRLARLPLAGCQFTLALPYAGTALHEDAARRGWLAESGLSWTMLDQTLPAMQRPDLPPATLTALRQRCYRTYYLHPMRLFVGLSLLRSRADLDDLLRRAANLASKLLHGFAYNR